MHQKYQQPTEAQIFIRLFKDALIADDPVEKAAKNAALLGMIMERKEPVRFGEDVDEN